jgi:dTDP-4-amino-4,6-dideoxygalactose transaminase
LAEAGIGAGIHYPRALHLQKSYDFLGLERGALPVAEAAGDKVLSLPNYPEMTQEMLEEVVEKAKALV